MFQKMLENVRGKCPLIHNITNYVTVNDCANIVLACGASPIMSDDQSEVEEITTICGGLNINIGTLNKRTIESMLLAGKRANALSHPVVLDPVGWTHDGLLTNVDINSMYLKHYPLFYTATCEFTRQDADATSGGEILFLNNRGGAIALISAIRPTYISSNEIFTNSLSRNLFRRDDANHYRRLGDIYRSAKNEAYSCAPPWVCSGWC